MRPSPDDRSRQAIAYHWASRIITVSLEMVLPGVVGYWLDGWLHTRVVFTIIGFGIGLPLGIVHLIRMSTKTEDSGNTPR